MIKFWIGLAIGLVCGGIIGGGLGMGAVDEDFWEADDDETEMED